MKRLLLVLALISGVGFGQATRLDQVAVRLDGKAGGTVPTGTANRFALFGPTGALTTDAGLTYSGTGATFTVLGPSNLNGNIGTYANKFGGVIVGGVWFGSLPTSSGKLYDSMLLNKDFPIAWSSDATWYGTPDLGLARASAGVLKVTDGSTGYGAIRFGDALLKTDTSQFYTESSAAPGHKPFSIRSYSAVGLSSEVTLGWTSTIDATATLDLGLKRSAAGVLAVTDGSTGAGKILVADGTTSASAIGPASDTTSGFSFGSGGNVNWAYNNASQVNVNGATGMRLAGPMYLGWVNGAANTNNPDTYLSRAAAATIQLGGANAASPVDQTLKAQGGSGTDKNGGKLTIEGGESTGAGAGGSVSIKTTPSSTTGSTANGYSTRYYIQAQPKTLTLGSATNFVRVDFPASSTVSIAIGYNVQVTDSAATPNFKVHGGRYYVSCYRQSSGSAACGTIVETGENSAQNTGSALTDTVTATGDANGVILAQQVAVGTGLTAPTVGLMTWDIHVHSPAAGVTVTPQ